MKAIFVVPFLFSTIACVRAEKVSFTKVSISIPDRFSENSLPLASKLTTKSINPDGAITVTGLNEINCLVVFVSGPEDDLKKNECRTKSDATPFKVGYFIGGLPLSNQSGVATTVDLDIRSGRNRALQLLGFKVITTAASGTVAADTICREFKNNKPYQSFVSDPYILAQSTGLDLAGGTVNVGLTAVFDATKQIDGCVGPDFVNFEDDPNANAPAQYAIIFQDDVGSGTTPLRGNSCVGVKVQIQDQSGRPARLKNVSYDAKIPQASQFGQFFRPNATRSCNGDLLNVASGDVSLSFNNANGPFSDNVLFFQPTASATGAIRQILVTDAPAAITVRRPILQSAESHFNYLTGLTVPAKYAVYDLMLNTSTAAATTSSQTKLIDKNVCRRASVQIVDSNGVPLFYNQSPTIYKNLVVSTIPTGSIEFYTDAACSGAETNALTLSIDQSGSFTDLPFYYKASVSVPQFSFRVTTVSTTGTNYLPGGDLTDANNLWGTRD